MQISSGFDDNLFLSLNEIHCCLFVCVVVYIHNEWNFVDWIAISISYFSWIWVYLRLPKRKSVIAN